MPKMSKRSRKNKSRKTKSRKTRSRKTWSQKNRSRKNRSRKNRSRKNRSRKTRSHKGQRGGFNDPSSWIKEKEGTFSECKWEANKVPFYRNGVLVKNTKTGEDCYDTTDCYSNKTRDECVAKGCGWWKGGETPDSEGSCWAGFDPEVPLTNWEGGRRKSKSRKH